MNPSLFHPGNLRQSSFLSYNSASRLEDPYSPKALMPWLPPVTTTTFPAYRVTAAIPSCCVCIPHPPGLFPPPKSREAVGWNQIYRPGH